MEEDATPIIGDAGHPEGLGGYCVKPIVFTNVSNDMTAAHEEILGHVLCILSRSGEDNAVEIANDTVYGFKRTSFPATRSAPALWWQNSRPAGFSSTQRSTIRSPLRTPSRYSSQ